MCAGEILCVYMFEEGGGGTKAFTVAVACTLHIHLTPEDQCFNRDVDLEKRDSPFFSMNELHAFCCCFFCVFFLFVCLFVCFHPEPVRTSQVSLYKSTSPH